MRYTTIVVSHRDDEAAREFVKVANASWPMFSDTEATTITAMSHGDVMSVSDAVGMALDCDILDYGERLELAQELHRLETWEDCKATFRKWDLAERDGDLVERELAQ